jgi:hypothetical protein
MLRIKVGYSVGLGLIHNINKKLEMQCRLLWEVKGYKQEQMWGAGSNVHKFTSNTTNNYITLSMAPRFYIGKENRFHIFSGLFYSRLMNSLTKAVLYYSNGSVQFNTAPNSPYINDYDMGILVGGGYTLYRFNKVEMLMQVQGDFSTVNIENNNSIIMRYNRLMVCLFLKFNR